MEEDKNNNENRDEIEIQGKNNADKQTVEAMVMRSEVLTKYMKKAQKDVNEIAEKFISEHPELAGNPDALGKLYDEEWNRANEKQNENNGLDDDLSDDMEQ